MAGIQQRTDFEINPTGDGKAPELHGTARQGSLQEDANRGGSWSRETAG